MGEGKRVEERNEREMKRERGMDPKVPEIRQYPQPTLCAAGSVVDVTASTYDCAQGWTGHRWVASSPRVAAVARVRTHSGFG